MFHLSHVYLQNGLTGFVGLVYEWFVGLVYEWFVGLVYERFVGWCMNGLSGWCMNLWCIFELCHSAILK